MRIGPLEIGLILVIVLIIFGVGKLPEVGQAIGKGLRAFREGQSGSSNASQASATPQEEVDTARAKLQAAETKLNAQAELESTRAKLAAAEARLREADQSAKKA